jgi:hypothetical protein
VWSQLQHWRGLVASSDASALTLRRAVVFSVTSGRHRRLSAAPLPIWGRAWRGSLSKTATPTEVPLRREPASRTAGRISKHKQASRPDLLDALLICGGTKRRETCKKGAACSSPTAGSSENTENYYHVAKTKQGGIIVRGPSSLRGLQINDTGTNTNLSPRHAAGLQTGNVSFCLCLDRPLNHFQRSLDQPRAAPSCMRGLFANDD